MSPHSRTLAWKLPWTDEPGRLQSTGSRRVWHDWGTSLSLSTFMHWKRKWQPTPVFLPGESQVWGSLVGCRLWGHTESDTTERLIWSEELDSTFKLLKNFHGVNFKLISSALGYWGTLAAFSEKAMASHSSTLAWKIPWTEEPGRLQSMGSLRVRHDWATSLSLSTFMHWKRKWQPTPVFLRGESQGWGSLVGYRVARSWTHLKRLSSSSILEVVT